MPHFQGCCEMKGDGACQAPDTLQVASQTEAGGPSLPSDFRAVARLLPSYPALRAFWENQALLQPELLGLGQRSVAPPPPNPRLPHTHHRLICPPAARGPAGKNSLLPSTLSGAPRSALTFPSGPGSLPVSRSLVVACLTGGFCVYFGGKKKASQSPDSPSSTIPRATRSRPPGPPGSALGRVNQGHSFL